MNVISLPIVCSPTKLAAGAANAGDPIGENKRATPVRMDNSLRGFVVTGRSAKFPTVGIPRDFRSWLPTPWLSIYACEDIISHSSV